jgi:hypothetical protein
MSRTANLQVNSCSLHDSGDDTDGKLDSPAVLTGLYRVESQVSCRRIM